MSRYTIRSLPCSANLRRSDSAAARWDAPASLRESSSALRYSAAICSRNADSDLCATSPRTHHAEPADAAMIAAMIAALA